MRIIQSLFNNYGIKFIASGKVQLKGKREYVYSLSVDEQIKNIVDVKHWKYHKIFGFKNLFK